MWLIEGVRTSIFSDSLIIFPPMMLWPHFIVRMRTARNHQSAKHHEKLMELQVFLTELKSLNASAQTLWNYGFKLNTLLHVTHIKKISVEDLDFTIGSHDTRKKLLSSFKKRSITGSDCHNETKSLITEQPSSHQNRRYTAHQLSRTLAKNF